MDKRIVIGGGVVAVALVLLGVRLASNSGAKSGLDAALAHLPPGYTATHGAVTYNALSGEAHVRDLAVFRLGAPVFAAGDVAVSGIGAQDETGTPRRVGEIIIHDASGGPYKHIDRIDLSGVYPATMREVFEARAYPGGKPAWTDKRLVLEHGEIHGVEGGQSAVQAGRAGMVDSTFGMGALTIDNVRLSQLSAPPDPSAPPMVLVAAVEAHMSGEGWTMRDMSFSATGKSAVHGGIARMSSAKYDGGVVSDFDLQGMVITTNTPPGTITIDGMGGHDLDGSKMLAMLPVLAADPATPHPEILNGVHLQSGEMHGLRADYAQGPLVTIDKISVRAAPASAVMAGKFTMTALIIKTSGRPVSPAARAQLESFGMADFTTDMIEEGGYDAAAGHLSFKRFDIILHDLGTLHMTMDITGLPATPAATPAQVQQAAASARLTDASVTWDDNSLTARLLKMTAAKQGVTVDQVRMGLSLPLASLAVLMPDQPDAVAQVNGFLNGQHRLAVTAKPPVPVGIAQFQATPVQERAALLGLRVTGN